MSAPVSIDPAEVRLGAAVRVPLLVLCLVLAALSVDSPATALSGGLLTAAAAAGVLLPSTGRTGELVRVLEAAAWAGVVTATDVVGSPYLSYLLAPALLGGLARSVRASLYVPATAAGTLLVLRALYSHDLSLRDFGGTAVQWVLLAGATAVITAVTRRLQSPAPVQEPVAAQQAAHRLLLQLRTLARRLPGSLDPTTTAEALLLDLQSLLPVEQAWVLVRSSGGGGGLVPLASVGGRTLEWDVSLSADSALAEAWATQQPVLRSGGHDLPDGSRSAGTAVALPLVVGPSVFGLVGLQTAPGASVDRASVDGAFERVQSVALSLDTGLLFDELRASATTEERLRLSREIHDGIAQELISVGYALDELTADAAGTPLRPGLVDVRSEVTRLVSDLRMSLFDLRSGMDLHGGLGAALSEHVRRIGASTGLTVHLTLSEGPLRLAPQAEAELMRIAQEAITNAVKHSGGRNLWVRCDIEPPNALLVVEDDGQGLDGPASPGSYGLVGMSERAARLKASLVVGARDDGPGTRVCLALGTVSAAP